MIVIKVNYTTDQPIIKVNYDDAPIYISTSVDATYINVDYGTGGGGGGGAIWGDIIGNLSDQLDLQAALDAKVPYTGATGDVDLGEYELKAGQIELDQSPTGTAGVAVTRWNDTIGSTETTLKGGNVILKNGVDLVARIVNKVTPNTTLTKAAYQAVRISGAQGQRLAVAFAQANNDNNSADTIGLVTETIATNQEGFIITVGNLEGINTTGSLQGETWADGDVLYLSPTIAGAITNVKPIAPQHLVVIGYVEYAHANNGKIYVKVMNGWELGELHDVDTTGATNGQVLKYNGSIWTPQNDLNTGTVTSVDLSAPTGFVVSGNPITSSGTLALSFASGYSLPTTIKQGNWDDAYTFVSAFPSQTGNSGKYLTTDGSTLSWGTVSTANIYNSDGTLTGNRTVTAGTYSLKISGQSGTDFPTSILKVYANSTQGVHIGYNTTSKYGYIGAVSEGVSYDNLFVQPTGGNVSIGTNSLTSFNEKLRVFGSIRAGISTSSPSIGNTSTLLFLNTTTYPTITIIEASSSIESFTSVGTSLSIAGLHQGTLGAYPIATYTNNSIKTLLTSSGRFLIGTTTESTYLLDVNGTGRFVSYLEIGDGTNGSTYINFKTLSSTNTWIGAQSGGGSQWVNGGSVGDFIIRRNQPASNSYLWLSLGNLGEAGYRYSFSNGTAIYKDYGTTFTTYASSILALDSTTRGFLPPRMTAAQKTAISTPATGLVIYQTDSTEGLYQYKSTGWEAIGGGGGGMAIGGSITSATAGSVLFAGTSGVLQQDNTNFFWDDTNNRLGIGTSSPSNTLDVNGTCRIQDNTTVSKNFNGNTILTISNTTAGTLSNPSLVLTSDSSSGSAQVFKYSSSSTAYKIISASDSGIYNAGAGDISFLCDVVGGKIKFSAGGGSTAQMTLTAAGRFLIGTTTEGTSILKVADTSEFGTNTFTNKLNASFGTIGIQSYSVNNAWFGDNIYFNGTNFVRIATGYTGLFYFAGNEGQFRWGSNGAAGSSVGTGATAGGSTTLKMNLDGTIAMGDMVNTNGVYTNASFLLFGSSKNIGINTSTDVSSAQLHITSTTKGFLPPRMTETQKNAISTPATGLLIYQTDGTEGLYQYKSTGWSQVAGTSGGGGISRSVNVISTTTTAGASASTDYVYLISGTTTLTLPTAVGNTNRYTLKNVGTNTVTINTTSSQTIDGSTSITMAVQYTALDVISDGTNWNII